ncbi:MAG: hypothetical protein KKG33_05470 [candidate division Zixibacteria bacterium]|nr:hypothetical protein [candidate division Zixibacteria bacterium]MBU1470703.1 hypothetical protein [candidate division Zixibacteria bacterium]MBU2624991.1 hypothetical protein [candidate division Zixibacteria bacterium]
MDALLKDCHIESGAVRNEVSREFVEIINQTMSPVRPLDPDEVCVRTMLVTSDAVNSQGGRFPTSELPRLCEMIPGTPVMIGHDKSKLPIARCFRSELVEHDGKAWVKAWFYWIKTTSGSEDLRRNIDGGIYTECSLGFSFGLPECSVCSGDIRKCSHIAGREYRGQSGNSVNCHFRYRNVSRVNEISLVYRGAVPGTAISDHVLNANAGEEIELIGDSESCQARSRLLLNARLADLPDEGVTAYPVYHGIPFNATQIGEVFKTSLSVDWAEFPPVKRAIEMLDGVFPPGSSVRGVVAIYRGKTRLPVYLMERIKRGEMTLSGRCRIKLFVPQTLRDQVSEAEMDRLARGHVDAISERKLVGRNQLDSAVESSPHEGLRIEKDVDNCMVVRNGNRFLLEVVRVSCTAAGKHCYDLQFGDSKLGCFRTYETRVPASVGDTLYVEADVAKLSGGISLRRIRVLDNLGSYFEPDRPWSSHTDNLSPSAHYSIRLVGTASAMLRLESESESRQIEFPVFSIRQLNSGKILVGYDMEETEASGAVELLDSGSAVMLEKVASGLKLRLNGQQLSGDYILRYAIHKDERVTLIYRAGAASVASREIMKT